jgi:hypothetical protein
MHATANSSPGGSTSQCREETEKERLGSSFRLPTATRFLRGSMERT